MNYSLQKKLLYSFMLIIIVLLIGVSVGVSLIIKEEMLVTKQQELITKGSELAQTIQSFRQRQGDPAQLPEFLKQIDGFMDSHVWVINRSRQVIAVSPPPHGGWMSGMDRPGSDHPRMDRQGMGSMMGSNDLLMQQGVFNELDGVFEGEIWTRMMDHPFYMEKMLVVGIPIFAADGSVEGAVLLNTPITAMNVFMQHIYYYIGIAGLVAFLLALVVVNWLTRGIVRPLKAMQERAGAMARGDYSAVVTIESHDEVGCLGLALNSLAQDLAKYIENLDEMEKLRRDFVANVSHEFRTPMTIIRGYNEALLDGTIDDPELARRYHLMVRDETVRLERLINDLLDLSRLQSATFMIDKEKLPLAAVVTSVVNLLQQQAEQKSIMLLVNNQEQLPDIWGNGDRIIQLLIIIIDNALKYTPAGGKVIVSTLWENDKVVVEVADTGIGIPAADLAYIWERLYKVDKSHSRVDSGTGLGLAIGKQIIDLHQAEATVSSQLNQGTIVRVKFPSTVG